MVLCQGRGNKRLACCHSTKSLDGSFLATSEPLMATSPYGYEPALQSSSDS